MVWQWQAGGTQQFPLIQGSLQAPKLVFSDSYSQCCSWALPDPLLRSRLREGICVPSLHLCCSESSQLPVKWFLALLMTGTCLSNRQSERGDPPVLGVLEAVEERAVRRQESGG